MQLNLLPTLAILFIGISASCSNIRTIQAQKLTLAPELTLDDTRVLSVEEIHEIEKAIENHVKPRKLTIIDISPIHAKDGGGVLALWIEATVDSESKKGYATSHGGYLLDLFQGQWVVRS